MRLFMIHMLNTIQTRTFIINSGQSFQNNIRKACAMKEQVDDLGARIDRLPRKSLAWLVQKMCSYLIHTKCSNFCICIYMMQLEGSVFRFTNRTCMSNDHVCYTWFVIHEPLNGDKPQKQWPLSSLASRKMSKCQCMRGGRWNNVSDIQDLTRLSFCNLHVWLTDNYTSI